MLACADGHASLVEGTGNFSRDINSPSPEAQDYFDQGLRLGYGYYFPEAVASFNAALCFDPDNARIHWARAQALGPNANSRNSGLPDDPQGEGAKALQLAIANMGEEPQQWKDMINALVPMFDMENLPDMATRSQAVIDSTRALYTQYPDDLEAAFTYTHAIMMASPWYYFEWDGTPRANTNDARAAMEKGMAQNPYHPGLTHLHVHLMEASREPVSAETSADALEPLTPMIGHMAHMPGHIFMRIGRYQDSIDANRRSVLADEYFVQQWGEREYPQYGTYFLSATNHRGHARMFIHWGGLLQGNADVAFEIVTPLAAATTAEQLDRGNSLRNVSVEWMTYKAFGMWDEILALPAQPDYRPFLQGTLNHVRGAAMAAGALEDHVPAAGGGEQRALAQRELADGQAGHGVHAVDGVAREAFEQSVIEHGHGAAAAFLGGLEDQVDGAGEIRVLLQRTGGAEEHGGVAVMPAGVHDGDVVARVVLGGRFADIRHRADLAHGQPVKIRAHEHRFARPILQNTHDTKSSDLFRHFKAQRSKLLRHALARFLLMKRQFGMRVQMLVKLDQGRQLLFKHGADGIRGVQAGGGKEGERKRLHARRNVAIRPVSPARGHSFRQAPPARRWRC
jgi:tetratricopeptide (TPR) repeat protein